MEGSVRPDLEGAMPSRAVHRHNAGKGRSVGIACLPFTAAMTSPLQGTRRPTRCACEHHGRAIPTLSSCPFPGSLNHRPANTWFGTPPLQPTIIQYQPHVIPAMATGSASPYSFTIDENAPPTRSDPFWHATHRASPPSIAPTSQSTMQQVSILSIFHLQPLMLG